MPGAMSVINYWRASTIGTRSEIVTRRSASSAAAAMTHYARVMNDASPVRARRDDAE